MIDNWSAILNQIGTVRLIIFPSQQSICHINIIYTMYLRKWLFPGDTSIFYRYNDKGLVICKCDSLLRSCRAGSNCMVFHFILRYRTSSVARHLDSLACQYHFIHQYLPVLSFQYSLYYHRQQQSFLYAVRFLFSTSLRCLFMFLSRTEMM